jgi:hypothetical protein
MSVLNEINSPFFGGQDFYDNDDPDSDSLIKTGGTIKTASNLLFWVATCILIIAILWVVIVIYRQIHFSGEDYNQRKARIHFNSIRGEEFDEEAKKAIEYGEAIQEPRAIDHYRTGAVYLLNAKNHTAAHRHFQQALNQIIEGRVDTREAPFILNRIADFNDMFIDFDDVDDDLPLQQAMLAHFNQQANVLNQVEKKKVEIAADDPEFKQKTLLSRQDWQSDSQNVHDTAIYEELKDQVSRVLESNHKIKDIQLHNYDEAINWLRVKYKDSPKKQDLEKAINVINNDYPIGSIPGVTEKSLLTAIWQRTFDPENKDRAVQIREAMGDAVLDCIENGATVCLSGRSSKVWQALAKLDKEPEMGILKTKQALRNEILDRSAKIMDDFIGNNGSVSQALKEAYNNDENTEQVKELKECIKTKISELSNDYKGLIPETMLQSTINECTAVV